MKKLKLSKLVTGLLGLAALVAVSSSPAQAAFVVGGDAGKAAPGGRHPVPCRPVCLEDAHGVRFPMRAAA